MTPGWDCAMDAVWAGMKTLISYISTRVHGWLGTSTVSSDILKGSALNSRHKISVSHVVNRCAVYPHFVPFTEHRQSRFSIIPNDKWAFCYWSAANLYPTLLKPNGLQPTRLICPWDFPGNNSGVGCHFLLQGIFPTQGSNPHLLHWQAGSLSRSQQTSCTVIVKVAQSCPILCDPTDYIAHGIL